MSRPGRSLPRERPGTLCTGAGWAPGPVWTCAENLAPPPGFDPRTVQPVASRYTDYATRPTAIKLIDNKIVFWFQLTQQYIILYFFKFFLYVICPIMCLSYSTITRTLFALHVTLFYVL